MKLTAPNLGEVLERIQGVRSRDGGIERSIAAWRSKYQAGLAESLQESDISVFINFVNNLLERATSGESWHSRVKKFRQTFHHYDDLTMSAVKSAFAALKRDRRGYRWGEDVGT